MNFFEIKTKNNAKNFVRRIRKEYYSVSWTDSQDYCLYCNDELRLETRYNRGAVISDKKITVKDAQEIVFDCRESLSENGHFTEV